MELLNKKLKIVFISPKRFSFYPEDYLGRGLGGTESMLVLLAEALAERGHIVNVYNCCYKPGIYNNVIWMPIWSFDEKAYCDIVISVRLTETFNTFKINAPLRAVWIHDTCLPGATNLDKNEIVNTWIAVSETQKQFIEKNESIKNDNWFVSSNAFDEKIYNQILQNAKKIDSQMIYCSAPDRGLKYLLEYWEEIKSHIENATLIISGSYALWGNADEENDLFFNDIYNKALTLDGVILKKRLSKFDLANFQATSKLMIYPTTFNEMFCISALECLSVGTPVISTAMAAMNERVENGKNGFLIKGYPSESKYKLDFIENIIRVLSDKKMYDSFSNNAKIYNREKNFANLAKQWETYILKRLKL